MEKSLHSPVIIPIASSKLLERLAYYSMRSILILYMMNQLGIEREDSTRMYSLFTLVMGIIPVIGGLIGDLVIGSRLASIIGGILQSLGFFVLAVPNPITLYLGLFLVAFGSGLYGPNLLSMLSYSYRERHQTLDAAMIIFYVCINIGAVAAPLFMMITSGEKNFTTGFILSGIIMLGSTVILMLSGRLSRETAGKPNIQLEEKKKTVSALPSILVIIAIFVLIPLFWRLFELSSSNVYERMYEADEMFPRFSYLYSIVSGLPVIPAGIALVLLFTFVRSSSFLKMSIGTFLFLFACILLGISSQVPISGSYLAIVLTGVVVQSVSELFIAPVALSLISRYGSVQYNATLLGGYLCFNSLVSSASVYLYDVTHSIPAWVLVIISVCISLVMTGIFLTFYFLTRKEN